MSTVTIAGLKQKVSGIEGELHAAVGLVKSSPDLRPGHYSNASFACPKSSFS